MESVHELPTLKDSTKDQCQQQPSSNMSGITSMVFVTNYIHRSEDIRKLAYHTLGPSLEG